MSDGTPYPPPPNAPPPPGYGSGDRLIDPNATADDRAFATFIHLTLLAHIVLPIVAIIAPIVMWQVKKDQSAFINDHGKEATNFNITLIIYWLISGPLVFFCGIGIVTAILVYILGLVGMILAAMAANRGEFYRYPMTFRFIK